MNISKTVDMATIILLIGVLVYVGGWAYAKEYFDGYQIGMNELKISTENIMIYGYWTIKSNLIKVAIPFFIMFGILSVSQYLQNESKFQYTIGPIFIVAYFVTVYFFYCAGEKHGHSTYVEQKENYFNLLPKIQIIKEEKKFDNDKKKTVIINGRLIINMGSKLYYLQENTKNVVSENFGKGYMILK